MSRNSQPQTPKLRIYPEILTTVIGFPPLIALWHPSGFTIEAGVAQFVPLLGPTGPCLIGVGQQLGAMGQLLHRNRHPHEPCAFQSAITMTFGATVVLPEHTTKPARPGESIRPTLRKDRKRDALHQSEEGKLRSRSRQYP